MFFWIKKIDWSLFLPALGLSLLGVAAILSYAFVSHDFSFLYRQIIFLVISLMLFGAMTLLDLRFLKRNSKLVFALYLFSVLLLAGLYLFGERVRGVRGWYRIGAFSFDPVPLAAIILIVVLSKYFALRHIYIKNVSSLLKSIVYFTIPFLLVLFQPDLGSALLLLFVWLGIVFFSGIPLKHLGVLFLIFVVFFIAGWNLWLKDYQKQRVITFLKGGDPQGAFWNTIQSKIAIGSGGLFGKGFAKGSQFHYGFLPEPLTDFIFSAFCEEFGFVGASFLIFLFAFLFWRLMRIALLVEDNFTRLFSAGLAFLFLGQAFVNIGMTLGILPVVGIPLPLVSYGGSHLIGFYLGLALLNSLKNRL